MSLRISVNQHWGFLFLIRVGSSLLYLILYAFIIITQSLGWLPPLRSAIKVAWLAVDSFYYPTLPHKVNSCSVFKLFKCQTSSPPFRLISATQCFSFSGATFVSTGYHAKRMLRYYAISLLLKSSVKNAESKGFSTLTWYISGGNTPVDFCIQIQFKRSMCSISFRSWSTVWQVNISRLLNVSDWNKVNNSLGIFLHSRPQQWAEACCCLCCCLNSFLLYSTCTPSSTKHTA